MPTHVSRFVLGPDPREEGPRCEIRGVGMLASYSLSAGLLNSGVRATAPCPFCGKLAAAGLIGDVFDAVSSGPNSTRLPRNVSTWFFAARDMATKLLRDASASP